MGRTGNQRQAGRGQGGRGGFGGRDNRGSNQWKGRKDNQGYILQKSYSGDLNNEHLNKGNI